MLTNKSPQLPIKSKAMTFEVPKGRVNEGFKVEGDVGDLQIVEESTDTESEQDDTNNGSVDKQVVSEVNARSDHPSDIILPGDIVQATNHQSIGSFIVTNSENVHFGNRTYFNGPVTVKKLVQPESAFDKTELKDTSFQKYVAQNWVKLTMWVVGILLLISTFVAVLTNTLNSQSGEDRYHAFNENYENGTGGELVVAPGHLRIVSRTDWLAQPVDKPLDRLRLPAPWVIITHTATPSCFDQSKCVLRVRLIQTFHIESREWDDIGYNFLVGGDGSAYVGRGWDYIGAHTKGYNKYSISIAFIGTFNTEAPTKIQVQACKNLIALGLAEGKLAKDYHLFGHRQLMSTLSPGDQVFDIIKTWPHFVNTTEDTDFTKLLPDY